MAARAYWKGLLKLALVSCPVVLYPASSSSARTHFHQINRETGNRLRQRMVDEETGEEVSGDQKARGYELSKGHYIEIEQDELDAVKLESTHVIDIDSFVPADDIDQRYLDKPYYIAPDGKSGAEAFVVIRNAMEAKGRVALARIVLTSREHVMALKPFEKGLLGITLRYPEELRDAEDYFGDIPAPRISRDMVDLAAHILEMKAAKFDPAKFKDRYESALKDLVERKASGKTIEKPEQPATDDNVIDLMDALKRSLGRGGKSAGRERQAPRTTRTRAPARRKAATKSGGRRLRRAG